MIITTGFNLPADVDPEIKFQTIVIRRLLACFSFELYERRNRDIFPLSDVLDQPIIVADDRISNCRVFIRFCKGRFITGKVISIMGFQIGRL